MLLDDRPQAGADRLLGYEDEAIDHISAQLEGDGAALDPSRGSVGERRQRVDRHNAACLDRAIHGGGVLGRAAHDFDRGEALLQVAADAADQAAAADSDVDGVELSELFGELETDCALPRDDVRVVVGGEVEAALPLREGPRRDLGLDAVVPAQPHVGPGAAQRVELARGAGRGGEDRAGRSHAFAGVERRQAVVAGGSGDDPTAQHVRLPRQQRVQGAAHLERTRDLLVLELEIDLGPGRVGEGGSVLDRRHTHVPTDPLGGFGDCVRQVDHACSSPSERNMFPMCSSPLRKASGSPPKPMRRWPCMP